MSDAERRTILERLRRGPAAMQHLVAALAAAHGHPPDGEAWAPRAARHVDRLTATGDVVARRDWTFALAPAAPG